MAEVFDITSERERRKGAREYGMYMFSADFYAPASPGDDYRANLSVFDVLPDDRAAGDRMREQAKVLEAIALILRANAEAMAPTDDGHVIMRAMAFQSSRVVMWTSNKVQTEEQCDWVRSCLDYAKEIVPADYTKAED